MSPTANTVYPSIGIDKRIPEFLQHFYRVSDDEDTAEEYLTLFASDASFQFLSIRLTGTEGFPPKKKMRTHNQALKHCEK
jgi:hypothetical protein